MFEPNLLSIKVLHVKHFRLVCLCLKKSFQAVWQIMVCSQDYLTLHFTCLLTGLYQSTSNDTDTLYSYNTVLTYGVTSQHCHVKEKTGNCKNDFF